MNNVFKIYKRLTTVNVKQRVLPLLLPLQNITFALIILVFANVIISKGKVDGELDYIQIKLFYNFAIASIFVIATIFAPLFLSGTLNSMVKCNTVEYLLSSKVSIADIVFAVFLRGFFSVIVLVVSAFPIACISFYFGVVGVARLIRLLICIFSYMTLLSTISLFISTIFIDNNISRLFSYLISAVILLLHLLILDKLVNNNYLVFAYFLISISLSLFLLGYSKKGRIFKQ